MLHIVIYQNQILMRKQKVWKVSSVMVALGLRSKNYLFEVGARNRTQKANYLHRKSSAFLILPL